MLLLPGLVVLKRLMTEAAALPGLVGGNHLIDGTPVRQSAEVAVVNEHIRLEFSGEMVVLVFLLLRVVLVDGPELNPAGMTPVNRLLEQVAFPYTPQYQAVSVLDQHLQGIGGERDFVTDFRIFMFDDGPVEINCNCHFPVLAFTSL